MITCRIGLISKSVKNKDCFLNLGEIFDKSIREDVKILYELHNNLRYLCPFKVKVKINGKNVYPDNSEEISIFQTQYKLTRKIWINGNINKGEHKFFSPQLYDITCMVPLFPDRIQRTNYPVSTKKQIYMFVLFPYTNPITRGEIIDNCLRVVGEHKACFFVIGTIQGKNTKSTCELTKRYLRTCGVQNDNIHLNQYDEFPDCILESLNMITFIMPDTNMKVFIAVQREDMNRVMQNIRLSTKLGLIEKRIELVCN